MSRKTLTFGMLLTVLTLTGCQTTKLSEQRKTICLALDRADALPVLTNEEKALIRERFSTATKDRLKTARAIKLELGCP